MQGSDWLIEFREGVGSVLAAVALVLTGVAGLLARRSTGRGDDDRSDTITGLLRRSAVAAETTASDMAEMRREISALRHAVDQNRREQRQAEREAFQQGAEVSARLGALPDAVAARVARQDRTFPPGT